MCEAKILNMEDIQETEDGYVISFRGMKEKQEIRIRRFLIPSKTSTPYKQRFDQYLNQVCAQKSNELSFSSDN